MEINGANFCRNIMQKYQAITFIKALVLIYLLKLVYYFTYKVVLVVDFLFHTKILLTFILFNLVAVLLRVF